MIARNAGYFFVGRLFANHTSGKTEGVLSKFTTILSEDMVGI